MKLWARYRLKNETNKLGTVYNDIKSCRVFSSFLEEKYPEIIKLSSLKRKHIEAFFEFLKKNVTSKKSKAVHIGKIRLLLNHAKVKGWDSPVFTLIYDKEASMGRGWGKPKVLPELEMNLLEDKSDLMSPQLKGIFMVLRYTGMRIGDVLSLRVENIRRGEDGEYKFTYPQKKSDGTIHSIDLRSSKMSKLRQALEDAIKANRGSSYVFPGVTIDQPCTIRGFGLAMKKFIFEQKIMVDEKFIAFKAHDARRLKITNAIKAGEKYNKISKKEVGHKDEKCTDYYVGGVSDLEENEDIKRVLEIDDELLADVFRDINFLE